MDSLFSSAIAYFLEGFDSTGRELCFLYEYASTKLGEDVRTEDVTSQKVCIETKDDLRR